MFECFLMFFNHTRLSKFFQSIFKFAISMHLLIRVIFYNIPTGASALKVSTKHFVLSFFLPHHYSSLIVCTWTPPQSPVINMLLSVTWLIDHVSTCLISENDVNRSRIKKKLLFELNLYKECVMYYQLGLKFFLVIGSYNIGTNSIMIEW